MTIVRDNRSLALEQSNWVEYPLDRVSGSASRAVTGVVVQSYFDNSNVKAKSTLRYELAAGAPSFSAALA